MDTIRLAWLFAVAELLCGAALVVAGDERLAGTSVALALWLFTFAVGAQR